MTLTPKDRAERRAALAVETLARELTESGDWRDNVDEARELIRVAFAAKREQAPEDESRDGLLYDAWCVIANASGGNWGRESVEWQRAATRWRDSWQSTLSSSTHTIPESQANLWRKTAVIEARQWDGTRASIEALCRWVNDTDRDGDPILSFEFIDMDDVLGEPVIFTLEGDLRVSVGSWIIKGVQGEFYACEPDIFASTYEPADNPRPVAAPVGDWREDMRVALGVSEHDDEIATKCMAAGKASGHKQGFTAGRQSMLDEVLDALDMIWQSPTEFTVSAIKADLRARFASLADTTGGASE